MVQVNEFLKNEKLPAYISSNKCLKDIGNIFKVFPKIGLTNFTEKAVIDNTEKIKEFAVNLINEINGKIVYLEDQLKNNVLWLGRLNDNIDKDTKDYAIIKEYVEKITDIQSLINISNGKVSLNLSQDIGPFKKGQSLFKVYNKIIDMCKNNSLKSIIKSAEYNYTLEGMYWFKTFSSENISSSSFNICFSSDGTNGLWDIATMSMRGIESCQSWSGQYKDRLIGTIADPFAGIIYLTSGSDFNNLGTKMIRRCVVRFIVDSKTKKSFLFLDRMYPSYDVGVFNAFADALKAKTNNNFKVVYGPNMKPEELRNSYIPKYSYLNKITTNYKTYMDTPVEYKKIINEKTLYKKNVKSKQTKFANSLKKSLLENKKLLGKIKSFTSPDANYLVQEIVLNFTNNLFSRIKEDKHSNSNSYMKKVCFYYFSNKKTLIKNFKKRLVNVLFNSCNKKISIKELSPIIKEIIPLFDLAFKTKAKELITSKSNVLNLP